jgi:hypothetical protein
MKGRLPVIEQIIQLWIQMFRRRIPRFQEKVVNAGVIDGIDGRVRVT